MLKMVSVKVTVHLNDLPLPSAVTRAGEHAAAQALPGLGGHVGPGARDRRHGRRNRQVADGRRA